METTLWGWVLALLSLSASTGAGLLRDHRIGHWILGVVSVLSGGAAVGLITYSLAQEQPWLVVLVVVLVGLGFLTWFLIARWRSRREWAAKRAGAIKTIISDYNNLLHQSPQKQRETLKGITQATRLLWKHYSSPAEREEDQPLYRAWSMVATLDAEPGDTLLDRLKEAVQLIAGLEGLKWSVSKLPDDASRLRTENRDLNLTVVVALDDLEYAYPTEWNTTDHFMDANLWKHSFATLRIQNNGPNNHDNLVARCMLIDGELELPCFWSAAPGRRFVPREAYAADLPVGHERLLLIAQVFGREKLWARLPADLSHVFHPVVTREKEIAQRIGEPRKMSPAGEGLDLGEQADLEVTFKARGLDYRERIRLNFDAAGPTIERLTEQRDVR